MASFEAWQKKSWIIAYGSTLSALILSSLINPFIGELGFNCQSLFGEVKINFSFRGEKIVSRLSHFGRFKNYTLVQRQKIPCF